MEVSRYLNGEFRYIKQDTPGNPPFQNYVFTNIVFIDMPAPSDDYVRLPLFPASLGQTRIYVTNGENGPIIGEKIETDWSGGDLIVPVGSDNARAQNLVVHFEHKRNPTDTVRPFSWAISLSRSQNSTRQAYIDMNRCTFDIQWRQVQFSMAATPGAQVYVYDYVPTGFDTGVIEPIDPATGEKIGAEIPFFLDGSGSGSCQVYGATVFSGEKNLIFRVIATDGSVALYGTRGLASNISFNNCAPFPLAADPFMPVKVARGQTGPTTWLDFRRIVYVRNTNEMNAKIMGLSGGYETAYPIVLNAGAHTLSSVGNTINFPSDAVEEEVLTFPGMVLFENNSGMAPWATAAIDLKKAFSPRLSGITPYWFRDPDVQSSYVQLGGIPAGRRLHMELTYDYLPMNKTRYDLFSTGSPCLSKEKNNRVPAYNDEEIFGGGYDSTVQPIMNMMVNVFDEHGRRVCDTSGNPIVNAILFLEDQKPCEAITITSDADESSSGCKLLGLLNMPGETKDLQYAYIDREIATFARRIRDRVLTKTVAGREVIRYNYEDQKRSPLYRTVKDTPWLQRPARNVLRNVLWTCRELEVDQALINYVRNNGERSTVQKYLHFLLNRKKTQEILNGRK